MSSNKGNRNIFWSIAFQRITGAAPELSVKHIDFHILISQANSINISISEIAEIKIVQLYPYTVCDNGPVCLFSFDGLSVAVIK